MVEDTTQSSHFWERLPPSKKIGRLQGRGYLFDDAGGKMSLMWLLLVALGCQWVSFRILTLWKPKATKGNQKQPLATKRCCVYMGEVTSERGRPLMTFSRKFDAETIQSSPM